MYDLGQEIKKIDALLGKVYSVNIIPSQYRDIYSVVYLYDLFSTSRLTDLDAALTLFVLEQIKSKLDEIILNQSTMILNQQIMIANQMKTLEQQQHHQNEMVAKLNRLSLIEEEHIIYLDMIERNTEATAYFSAATYLQNALQ